MSINRSFTSLARLLVSSLIDALLKALHLFVLYFTLQYCAMIKRFVGCGGGRFGVREGGVWRESRAKVEVSRLRAEAERVREMAREEIKKLGRRLDGRGRGGRLEGSLWWRGRRLRG